MTSLHWAAKEGASALETVRLLLDRGANVNAITQVRIRKI